MAKAEKRKLGNVGCGLIVLAVVGAIIGFGLWLGKRDRESKTPCERYAEVMARALDNCHSGVNRSARHHVAICEQSVDPTPSCLKRVKQMKCNALEIGPSAFGEVCQKQP